MGFWSSVGSFVSSIGSAVSAGISAIGSGLSKLGNVVGSMAIKLGGGLGLAVASFIPVLGKITLVVEAITMIAQGLGLIGKEEQPEELGQKAEMSEKKPEDFDSTQEYIEYLKNEVALDKEKFKNITEDELMAYKITGSAILLDGISEKKGIQITPTFIRDMAKVGLNGKQMEGVIDKFKEEKAKPDLEGYFKGDLSVKEDTKIESALEGGLKSTFDNMTTDEIFEKIDSIRDEYFKEG
ncbi:MAG: hypothetical protein ACRC30_15715 [Clostridium sp.]